MQQNDSTKTIDNIFNAYDSFTTEIFEEYRIDFGKNILNSKIKELFTKELPDENKIQFLVKIEKLRNNGHHNKVEKSSLNLKKIKEDLELLESVKKFIGGKNQPKLNDLCATIDKTIMGYDIKQEKAFNIFQQIKNSDLDNNFAYREKISDEFLSIKKIYEQFETKILEKKLEKKNANQFFDALPLFEKYKIKTKKQSITPAEINSLKNKVMDLEEVHVSNILNNKKDFDVIKSKLKSNLKQYVSKYNEIAEKVNKTLNFYDNLIWKIKIDKISSVFEKPKIQIMQEAKERQVEDLLSNASSGQKKVLTLSLLLLDADSYDYIILDDPINSLDSDNIDLIINLIKTIKTRILLLTHNFSFINKFSFFEKNKSNLDLYIMDSFKDTKTFIFKTNWEEVNSTFSLLQKEVRSELQLSKYSMVSSVLYEYIDGYIENSNAKGKKNEYLNNLKKLINKYTRHWKNYFPSIEKLSNEIFNEENKNHNTIIFGENSVFSQLQVFDNKLQAYNNKKDLTEYFTIQNTFSNISSFLNNKEIELVDYISLKYLIAMSIRQEAEKFIVNLDGNEKELTKWNNNETMGLCLELIPKKLRTSQNKNALDINDKMHFVNHLDNLKWTPIMELPLHKMNIYLNKINDIIYKNNKKSE